MGRVLGQDNVTCELPRGEPEGEVWWLVQLEFSVDPARREEPSAGTLHCRDSREKLSAGPETMNLNWAREGELKKLFMSHSEEGERLEQMPWVRSISSIHPSWNWAARKDEVIYHSWKHKDRTRPL